MANQVDGYIERLEGVLADIVALGAKAPSDALEVVPYFVQAIPSIFDTARRHHGSGNGGRQQAIETTALTNALLPEQLQRFLSKMREMFPSHYPLAATLALTGLRFCHASALRWEDFDEEAGILRIQRR